MITFSPHKLAINGLIALIMNEAIKWLDNRAEVESFWDGIDKVLASGRAVVVVGAFENKAEALGHESDLRCFSPAKETKGYLSHTVVLGHVIHRLTPTFQGTTVVKDFPPLREEAPKSWVSSMTNCVVEI
jgi:hypothetical protein